MYHRAFTLIELLIVIAIAVIIAGALVPLFSATKQDAKFAKALSEMEAIRTAHLLLYQDTEYRPYDSGVAVDLIGNPNNIVDWQGPYLDYWPNDPWGEPYFMKGFANGTYYVYTYGPDRAIQLMTDTKVLIWATQ